MITAIIVLSILRGLTIGTCIAFAISFFHMAEERNEAQDERDTAQNALTAYHQQWRTILHYLSHCYRDGRHISQEGLDLFFTGRGGNYHDWIEWMVANSPVDDGEW